MPKRSTHFARPARPPTTRKPPKANSVEKRKPVFQRALMMFSFSPLWGEGCLREAKADEGGSNQKRESETPSPQTLSHKGRGEGAAAGGVDAEELSQLTDQLKTSAARPHAGCGRSVLVAPAA